MGPLGAVVYVSFSAVEDWGFVPVGCCPASYSEVFLDIHDEGPNRLCLSIKAKGFMIMFGGEAGSNLNDKVFGFPLEM